MARKPQQQLQQQRHPSGPNGAIQATTLALLCFWASDVHGPTAGCHHTCAASLRHAVDSPSTFDGRMQGEKQ